MREPSGLEVAPQEKFLLVEKEIGALLEKHGKLEQRHIVEAARDAESPLHDLFEWDDTTAATEHRLLQARQLIRVVVLRPHIGEPNPLFGIVGSGRLIQIVRRDNLPKRGRPRSVSVSRGMSDLIIANDDSREETNHSTFSPGFIANPEVETSNQEGQNINQKIRNEIIALSSVKSRLVAIPEAIDIAREVRKVISDLEGLLGRLGKTCDKCGLRNHIPNDGVHECMKGSGYSGSSNLSEASRYRL